MSSLNKLTKLLEFSFDPESLSKKYELERNKRIRPEGDAQYSQLSLSTREHQFMHDPFMPHIVRDALELDLDVLVIGGGWAGLIASASLKSDGITNFRIVDGGGDFGGTWYWNRYPGCQCDIQSYTYLPLLEETGYIPKERYSYAPEIQEHAQRIGKHFGLYDQALFQTFVTGLKWDEEASQWQVATSRGDRIRARFVIMALGGVHQLRLPGVPGIDEFQGHSFHTSRWDYDYTGGSPTDHRMDKLADKRVAVIGTGATAIQCIPPLAESAGQLLVFQRTPSTVSHRNNQPTDPEWAKSLGPGWQRDLIRQFERAMVGETVESDVINDEDVLLYVKNIQKFAARAQEGGLTDADFAEVVQLADYDTMEGVRARVEQVVFDKETAEKLKPWYNFFCKRPTFHNGYLQAFNRDNVSLIDVSETQGIERITANGIVANGVEYEVDCIVFASGFEATTTDYKKRWGIPIEGCEGRSLFDNWREGMRSMHAMMFNGFPNLINVGGLFPFQVGLNYSVVVRDQAEHASYIISQVMKRHGKSIQPTLAGEETWLQLQLSEGAEGRPIIVGGAPESCTPGYYNYEGKPANERPDIRREGFDKGALVYLDTLAKWRANGNLEGMRIDE